MKGFERKQEVVEVEEEGNTTTRKLYYYWWLMMRTFQANEPEGRKTSWRQKELTRGHHHGLISSPDIEACSCGSKTFFSFAAVLHAMTATAIDVFSIFKDCHAVRLLWAVKSFSPVAIVVHVTCTVFNGQD